MDDREWGPGNPVWEDLESERKSENPRWGTIEGGTVEGAPPRIFWGGQWVDARPYQEYDGCDFRVKYQDKWWSFMIGKENREPRNSV